MTELDDASVEPSLPPSLRTAGDSWSITELVGATALGVAASRAVETAGPNPLIRDDFARLLVSSAGPAWARLAAAELDSRAFRLNWPADTAVYEIDQPKVLEDKTGILERHGAVAVASRRPVPVDLRDDWPAALTVAGFDRAQPTAWLAEGLLPYLPSDAQDPLFEMFTALSAAGSRGAIEVFGINSSSNTGRWTRLRERLGLHVNVEALTYNE